MSVSSITHVMSRITDASKDSPIAVFIRPNGMINAIFAATVQGAELVKNGRGLVGVYDNTMDDKRVKAEILNEQRRVQSLIL